MAGDERSRDYPAAGRQADTGRYWLRCAGCGARLPSGVWVLHCAKCGKEALLVTGYRDSLRVREAPGQFFSYAGWLPYGNGTQGGGPEFAAFRSDALGSAIGLQELWVVISGYAPRLGAVSRTGTFKECEAIGVLNRVREQTDRTLIVSSAGNAGRAFLELSASMDAPVVVVMPEQAGKGLLTRGGTGTMPLLILIRDAHYPDAIAFVDRAVARFPEALIREGGCANVARRDSMGVPFLRAAMAMGGLPDWYVQAVGSGTGAIAAWEGACRLRQSGLAEGGRSRLLLVQNSPFTPMVDAWSRGSREIAPMTDAEVRARLSRVQASVLSNATPPYGIAGGVYDSVRDSGGDMLAVENDEIMQARHLAQALLGYQPCMAASAALAGLIRAVHEKRVNPSERVLLHLTGGGLDELYREPAGFVEPEALVIGREDDGPACAGVERYLATLQSGAARGRHE